MMDHIFRLGEPNGSNMHMEGDGINSQVECDRPQSHVEGDEPHSYLGHEGPTVTRSGWATQAGGA